MVCTAGWPQEFLGATCSEWDPSPCATGHYFRSPEVFAAAQNLVRALLERPAPVRLADAGRLLPDVPPQVFGPALPAALRYLLLFRALDAITLDVLPGVRPGITKRLFARPPEPPRPVEARDAFEQPFLVEDMTAAPAACAVEPFRLRAGDMALFAKAQNLTAAGLGTLPEWIGQDCGFDVRRRIRAALFLLRDLGFVDVEGRPGRDLRLEVSDAGRNWITLGPAGRRPWNAAGSALPY